MPTFTQADGADGIDGAAAERLATEQDHIVECLINLEEHLGRRLLDATMVAGVTLERRAKVLDDFATLWARYESYRIVAVEVRTIMARSPVTQADLREVRELVTRAAELAGAIQTIYGRIHEVVVATDEVWTVMASRIDVCDTLLDQAHTLVANLSLAAGQDSAAGVVTELADRFNHLRRIALADPLRFWAHGAVAVDEVDQLIAQCEQVRADLQTLAELRQHGPRLLDELNATLIEVRRLEEQISAERRRVNVKILAAPVMEEGAQSMDLLGPRLATALELYRCEHWRQLASDLPVLERDAQAARKRAQAELIETGRPLRQRAELRGRLSAYRAKAAGLGRIEDLALEQRYQRARTLLWRAPCDLAVAAAAVAQYQDAVNAMAAEEHSP
ncbi:MAG: hypothetical protein DLM60_03080 [Pseudonocardiales bacterium]|nr:MAG: hypothetical protein DLM60_03080 [Pseudonocardiales bacterium]